METLHEQEPGGHVSDDCFAAARSATDGTQSSTRWENCPIVRTLPSGLVTSPHPFPRPCGPADAWRAHRTGAPPAQAPARLDVTGHDPSTEIAPEICQTFAVDDGRAVRVRVPDSATRLFLGFADGFLYRGDPGWYDNNDGKLTVTVAATAADRLELPFPVR